MQERHSLLAFYDCYGQQSNVCKPSQLSARQLLVAPVSIWHFMLKSDFVFFVTFPDNALLVFLKIGLHERRNFVKVRIVADVVNVLALVNEMQSTWLEVFDTHLMKLFHRW